MAKKNPFDFWDWDKYPEVKVFYVGRIKSVGPFKRAVFVFQRESTGEQFHSWAYAQLSILITDVPFGYLLRIKCLGNKKMPDKNYSFRDFEVEVISAGKKKEG